MLVVVVGQRVVAASVDAGSVEQETLHRSGGASVAVAERVDADHVEVGDDGSHDWVPAGGRAFVEPPEEAGHQFTDLFAVGRWPVGTDVHGVVPVTARLVVGVVDSFGQHPVKTQYQRLV